MSIRKKQVSKIKCNQTYLCLTFYKTSRRTNIGMPCFNKINCCFTFFCDIIYWCMNNREDKVGVIMRFIVQRVTSASVTIDGNVNGKIGNGFLVLIGIEEKDNEKIADKMVDKLIKLRIFEDENGKSNIDLDAVNGGLLLISQFTLYADCKKGNRPSYIRAAKPDLAIPLYDYIVDECKKRVDKVETGVFGADMKVELLNDGPFTIILDSDEIM